ncbi:MAG: hypothetical protein DPW11_01495 [bacterium]|nr:hypothetical protein [Candidatus Microgenomates bacterium CPR3]MCQ3944432.1 hypothetical protein [bacterium]RIK51694.1 MAG: hypothetical protein DCC61_02000 [Candidatus Microgenomates bacterium]
MQSIFEAADFGKSYDEIVFPGKAEDERILYVTREAPMMLMVRLTVFMLIVATTVLVGSLMIGNMGRMLEFEVGGLIALVLLIGAIVMMGGLWWIAQVFNKTLFIITSRRLTKFIHTTPWTRYQMSLGLDKVVDSGAYSKGYLQAMFGLGTFVARSSAGNIKNFKIENIHFAEDLHNWMNKLMFTFNKSVAELDNFKPFVAKSIGKRD